MKRKNIQAILLALVMALNFSLTAFAATTQPTPDTTNEAAWTAPNSNATLELDGIIYAPTIKVTISTATDIIVNPYGLDYKPGGTGDAVQDTIIAAPALITSDSDVKLKVEAVPTVKTIGTEVSLVSTSAEAADGKNVFLFLELKNANSNTGDYGITTWTAPADYNSSTTTTALFKKAGETPTKAELTMAAKSTTSTYAAFNIIGTSGKPLPGGKTWNPDTDTLTLNVVFTFTPDTTTP